MVYKLRRRPSSTPPAEEARSEGPEDLRAAQVISDLIAHGNRSLKNVINDDQDAAEQPSERTIIENLHVILAKTPATIVVQELHSSQQLEAFKKDIVPFVMGILGKYAKDKDPTAPAFEDFLNPEEKLYFTLLYAKDAGTAEHCLDVFMRGNRILGMKEMEGRVDDEQRKLFLAGCILHDCGKCELPNIGLLNPLFKDSLKYIYQDHIASGDRGALRTPKKLEGSIEPSYAQLLNSPQDLDNETRKRLAEEFIRIYGDKIDFREEVPVGALFRASLKLLDDVQHIDEEKRAALNDYIEFPDNVTEPDLKRLNEYLKSQKLPSAQAIRTLLEQKDDLAHAEEILRIYEIDPNTSFKDFLDMHELRSVETVVFAHSAHGTIESLHDGEFPDKIARLLHIIGMHHNNSVTGAYKAELDVTATYPAPAEDQILYYLIRVADIIEALAQRRIYRAGEPPNTPEYIARILGFEIKKGFLDKEITEAVIREFIEPHYRKPYLPETY